MLNPFGPTLPRFRRTVTRRLAREHSNAHLIVLFYAYLLIFSQVIKIQAAPLVQ